MKSSLFLTGLVCSALAFGCGDDKTGVTGNTPTNPTKTSDDADTTDGGNSETGNPTTGNVGTSGGPDQTTNVSGGTTGVDPSASTGGATFIVDPDGGSGPKECDVFAQDCPDGQKCSAYASNGGTSWNALKCVPVMENAKQPGDVCTVEGNGVSGIDDCDLGSYCWDSNAENVGYCVALCTGSPEAPTCLAGFTCAVVNDGVLNLCLASCDPLAQDCAMEDDLCIPTDDGFLCVLDASGDEGQIHDPCEYANSCDKGLLCLNSSAAAECDPNSSGCCEPFCDLSANDPDSQCTGVGQKCEAYFADGQAPPDYVNVGICAVPM